MSEKSSLKPRRTPRARDSHPGQEKASARKIRNRAARGKVSYATKQAGWAEVLQICPDIVRHRCHGQMLHRREMTPLAPPPPPPQPTLSFGRFSL